MEGSEEDFLTWLPNRSLCLHSKPIERDKCDIGLVRGT